MIVVEYKKLINYTLKGLFLQEKYNYLQSYLEKLSKVPAWNKDNIQKPNSRKTYNVKEGSTIK